MTGFKIWTWHTIRSVDLYEFQTSDRILSQVRAAVWLTCGVLSLLHKRVFSEPQAQLDSFMSTEMLIQPDRDMLGPFINRREQNPGWKKQKQFPTLTSSTKSTPFPREQTQHKNRSRIVFLRAERKRIRSPELQGVWLERCGSEIDTHTHTWDRRWPPPGVQSAKCFLL